MYGKRSIESTLQALRQNSRGRIIVLTGARQVGKSTLAKQLYGDYFFVDMDSPVERSIYAAMTPSDWHEAASTIVIDEIQKLPELFDTVKACYDRFPEMKFVLLGSSQIRLMQGVRETLAGRSAIKELYTFTLPEIINYSGGQAQNFLAKMLLSNDPNGELKKLSSPKIRLSPAVSMYRKRWEYYLHWGGMPRLLTEEWDDEDRFAWLLDYQKTFLQRDVADLACLSNLEPFSKAQKTAALNTAQQVNFSELARNASITSPTAQRFMRYLEMSYQIILLPPWLKNKTKRLVKMPKLHFLDPGVRRAILGKRGEIDGAEFESAVVGEIYKQCSNTQLTIDFHHFRTYDGREVDMLLELEKGYIAIECKLGDNVSTTDTRHLKELNTILDKPLLLSLVVSSDANIRLLNREQNIWNVPAFMLLA